MMCSPAPALSPPSLGCMEAGGSRPAPATEQPPGVWWGSVAICASSSRVPQGEVINVIDAEASKLHCLGAAARTHTHTRAKLWIIHRYI